MVVDGTGRPAVRADVLVQDDTIVHVGAIDPAVRVRKTVDAEGKIVAPGFIDPHSHGDPLAENNSFLAQGVTTICVGQDGRSPSDDRIRYWAKRVGRRRLRLNVAPFVGHGTVRGLAGVGASKDPTDKQLQKMARLVAREMDAGGWGLSTGLEYAPGIFAPLEELVHIAKPVAERNGVVMSHLRSEDDDKIDAALDELIAQGSGSGARVHVAHLKVVYGRGADRAERLLDRMKTARQGGVHLTADIYPYNASYTTIGIVFPAFAKPPNSYRKVVRTRRDELAEYLRKRIARRGGPEATLFGSNPWRGKTLAQVADELGRPFEDILIDEIGPGGASAAYFVMDDELQSRLLVDPHVMIGSDGRSTSRHPRGYGTFARVIREYVVKRKALSIEEAVRKMTGLTAQTVGLDRLKRGLVRAGYAADLVVFDPAAVIDRATYEDPNRLARGFDWVLVNGVAVRREGKSTGARAGRVLLRVE
jgi:N-acyl-D-aspartate/D-glutamate deacylase